MNGFTLTMALLMGLTGSLHCAGMCGPIIWVMPFQAYSGYKKWLGILLYHFGRISIYALLGVILFSFKSIFQPQIQQYISIGLGVLLLLVGLASFFPAHRYSIKLPWTDLVRRNLSRFIAKPSVTSLFITGMLNGLLPCGLVYMALSASVMGAHTPVMAASLMYVFGLGTMPMLITLTVIKDKAKFLSMAGMRRFVPAFMLFFGCLFVLRGLNLGIPYVSPKVTVEQNTVKAQCCHKE